MTVLRLLINAAALWVAVRIVPGVSHSGGWLGLLGVALIFGFVNTVVGMTAKVLTFPLIFVTLGLFIFVINGLMLWLTSAVSGRTFHAGQLNADVLHASLFGS